VFDALTMQRPYKTAWSTEETIEFINNRSGTHFDPRLVSAFNEIIEQLVEIMINNQ